MAERIFNADLDYAFRRYVGALKSLGMGEREGYDVAIVHGSRKNDNSFKLVWIDRASGARAGAPGACFGGFIGWTKREAWLTLNGIARALEDVRYFQTSQ